MMVLKIYCSSCYICKKISDRFVLKGMRISFSSVQFKAENVKTAANYPQDNDGNLKTLLYIEIPTAVNSTTSRIPGEILLTIITSGNRTLSSEVGQSLGRVMSGQTLLRSEERGVDNELNRIMIPFAFVLLLVIALVCWVLHRAK